MSTTSIPTCKQIMAQLKKLGKESHRKTFIRHGGPANAIYGVPVADLKPIQKRIKKHFQLALDLFDTGIADAQYLAGLIADESRMTKKDLNKWAREGAWRLEHGGHLFGRLGRVGITSRRRPGNEMDRFQTGKNCRYRMGDALQLRVGDGRRGHRSRFVRKPSRQGSH